MEVVMDKISKDAISKENPCKSSFDTLLEKRLEDPDFKKEWDAIQPDMEVIRKEIERSDAQLRNAK